jgi:hypothetical protein
MAAPTVRLIEERRFDPPRAVEVEHTGRWWPGFQYAWRLCDDHRGWMADLSWTEQHEWGLGTYRPLVPPPVATPSPSSPASNSAAHVTQPASYPRD